MELKQYVRKGEIGESTAYQTICKFSKTNPPDFIITMLEGKCRRKIHLSKKATLFENYHAECFVGLEDYLLGKTWTGAAGVYPGSHYILWNAEDLLSAITIQPELARRAIFDLSRRIRIYDAQKHNTDLDLRMSTIGDIGAPDAQISSALYEMSFSADDSFPAHLVEQLTQNFAANDTLMTQGDQSTELYIILEGTVEVFMNTADGKKKIDTLGESDMVGEMAQFDGLPRSADVVAKTATKALVFTTENFHMLFQLHPKWAKKLLTTLAERLEIRRQSLANQ